MFGRLGFGLQGIHIEPFAANFPDLLRIDKGGPRIQ